MVGSPPAEPNPGALKGGRERSAQERAALAELGALATQRGAERADGFPVAGVRHLGRRARRIAGAQAAGGVRADKVATTAVAAAAADDRRGQDQERRTRDPTGPGA